MRDDKPEWVRIGPVELTRDDHGLVKVEGVEYPIDMNNTGIRVTLTVETIEYATVDATQQAKLDAAFDDDSEQRLREALIAVLAANYVPDFLPSGNSREGLARNLLATVDRHRTGRIVTETRPQEGDHNG